MSHSFNKNQLKNLKICKNQKGYRRIFIANYNIMFEIIRLLIRLIMRLPYRVYLATNLQLSLRWREYAHDYRAITSRIDM